MAKDCSFDIVSEYDKQELVNAVDQVKRELTTRFDLKGSNSDVILDADIAGVNMGFVHSKSDYSDLIVAPAFDYEYSFFYPITDMAFSNLDQDVAYLYGYNPSVFSEVQKTFSLNLLPNSKQTKEIQNIFSEYPHTRGSENSNMVINNLINLGSSFERVSLNAANISPAEMGC